MKGRVTAYYIIFRQLRMFSAQRRIQKKSIRICIILQVLFIFQNNFNVLKIYSRNVYEWCTHRIISVLLHYREENLTLCLLKEWSVTGTLQSAVKTTLFWKAWLSEAVTRNHLYTTIIQTSASIHLNVQSFLDREEIFPNIHKSKDKES